MLRSPIIASVLVTLALFGSPVRAQEVRTASVVINEADFSTAVARADLDRRSGGGRLRKQRRGREQQLGPGESLSCRGPRADACVCPAAPEDGSTFLEVSASRPLYLWIVKWLFTPACDTAPA
jgi:hypothetical protein